MPSTPQAALRSLAGAAAVLGAILSGEAAAMSGAEAIQERRALEKANGDARKQIVLMIKGQAPFDLATVQRALKIYIDAAEKVPRLLPPDSKTGDTNALPTIWDNLSDFDARYGDLGTEARVLLTDIKDEASFKAKMPDIDRRCPGCHESYRARLQDVD